MYIDLLYIMTSRNMGRLLCWGSRMSTCVFFFIALFLSCYIFLRLLQQSMFYICSMRYSYSPPHAPSALPCIRHHHRQQRKLTHLASRDELGQLRRHLFGTFCCDLFIDLNCFNFHLKLSCMCLRAKGRWQVHRCWRRGCVCMCVCMCKR